MKKLSGMVLALLVSVPALAGSVTVTDFGGEGPRSALELDSPGTVLVEVPAGAMIERAVMEVRPLPAGEPTAYPVSPALSIGGSVVWAFNGTGYGPFGEQNIFSDGSPEAVIRLGEAGGEGALCVRLPAKAVVEEARMEVACDGTAEGWADSRFFGPGPSAHFGFSMATVGDVNGDWLEDFLIGAPDYDGRAANAGMAVLYFGDRECGGRPGLVMEGTGNESRAGYSVSGAGDINGDGYADFLVGSPGGSYWNGANQFCPGLACLYFGGPGLDATPEFVFSGVNTSADFGHSVSGGGDINGDGYDDIVVCSPREYLNGYMGLTYVYHGGPGLDTIADVMIVNYNYTWNLQGSELKTAEIVGDVDGDGFDDILVLADRDYYHGRCPHTGPEYYALANLYFGAAGMDPSKYLEFIGKEDYVANAFSGVGDINGDGFADLMLTEVWNKTSENLSGVASIYLGNPRMDTVTDTTIPWGDLKGGQGLDVSRAGDVNGDGYDDVIMGVGFGPLGRPGANGTARVYYGGAGIDTTADEAFNGSYPMDFFGGVVSSAGDVDGDGCDELLAAAAGDNTAGGQAGLVNLYNQGRGLADPWLRLCCANGSSGVVWGADGLLSTRETTRDIAPDLDAYLRNASINGSDSYGNSFVEVPFLAGAAGAGNLAVTGMRIRYNVTALVPDLAEAMNGYLSAHRSKQMDVVQIPIEVVSATPARFRLSGLNLSYNLPPRLLKSVPEVFVDEETIGYGLLDAGDYFAECDGLDSMLQFSVIAATDDGAVAVGLVDGRYLMADARTGPSSANWSGSLQARLVCTDHHGLRAESNPFLITVRNVRDPPVITSAPAKTAEYGRQYIYYVKACDGDGDALGYSLEARPAGMTIDPATGVVRWYPLARGAFDVSVRVTDGKDSARQNFTVDAWKNTPPAILGDPPGRVFAGAFYEYKVQAFDEERDRLGYELRTAAAGLVIDPNNGRLAWSPTREQVGRYPVTVSVTDSFGGRSDQYFTIEVLDDRPRCAIDHSTLAGTIEPTAIVRGSVVKAALPVASVEIAVDDLGWRTARGTEKWWFNLSTLALGPGKHVLLVRAYDGNYSEVASAAFSVSGALTSSTGPDGTPSVSPVPVLLLVMFISAFVASGRRARHGGRRTSAIPDGRPK